MKPLIATVYAAFCMLVLCACTTTKISSHTIEKPAEFYKKIIVIFSAGGDFQKRKALEDKIAELLRSAGTDAAPSYQLVANEKDKKKIVEIFKQSGGDAILLIKRSGDTDNNFLVAGAQAGTTESYTSTSRFFRATLIDIAKDKTAWIAGAKTSTLSPSEMRMFSDFQDSALGSYANNLLMEMQSSGLIKK